MAHGGNSESFGLGIGRPWLAHYIVLDATQSLPDKRIGNRPTPITGPYGVACIGMLRFATYANWDHWASASWQDYALQDSDPRATGREGGARGHARWRCAIA